VGVEPGDVGGKVVLLKSKATSVALGTEDEVWQVVGHELEVGVRSNEVELPSAFPVWLTIS
jgi:hypothetical protein